MTLMNTPSAVFTTVSNKNALATPSRSTAAVFSSELETRNHLDRMQRERDAFNSWLNANDYEFLSVADKHFAWESWKASARLERSNA